MSRAVRYRMDAVAHLRRQMATSSSQDLFFSSQDDPERTKFPAGTLDGQKTQRKVRERVMALRCSDAWESNETNQLPRSFPGLKQIYSETTAMSFEFSALVGYPVHVV